MALRKRGNRYFAYYRDIDGKQVTCALKTSVKSEAVSMHEKLMVQVRAKKGMHEIVKRFPSTMRPEENIVSIAVQPEHKRGTLAISDMWETALKYRQLSESHKKSFDRFQREIRVRYADQVTPSLALEYLEKNYSKGNGKTFNNNKTILNTIFKLCLVEANLKASPFEKILNRRVNKVESHRPLTKDEYEKIMNSDDKACRLMACLSWYTGMRLETCARVSGAMIDLNDNSLTITPGKTSRFKRAVYIPIHKKLMDYLKTNFEFNETPFSVQAGFKNEKSFSIRFIRLLKNLNINDTQDGKASFHSIRASFITRMDEAGIPRHAIQGIVGQVSEATTNLYSHDKETAKKILSLE